MPNNHVIDPFKDVYYVTVTPWRYQVFRIYIDLHGRVLPMVSVVWKWNDVLGFLCASAGDNEVKFMMKHPPEWVRTSDPVIRIPVHYCVWFQLYVPCMFHAWIVWFHLCGINNVCISCDLCTYWPIYSMYVQIVCVY